MKINKKIIVCIAILFSMLYNASSFAQTLPPNNIQAQGAVLIENDTGKILYDKNSDKKMFPASTTKIMTALVAIEKVDLEKKVTVPEDFPLVDGSSMYLLPGETFTNKELLEALLIHSANDAAVLLAMEVSGDVNSFVTLMNEKAKELGAKNTHFANPHGLHDPNHYTTTYDMAIIAREAMKNEFFRQSVSKPNLILNETPKTKEKRMYNNTNRFLWSNSQIIYKNKYIPIKYNIVDGIKTGYTLEAGNCLVSSALKDGMRVISVVYHGNGFEVYRDSRELLDYGFDNYKVEKIIKSTDILGTKDIKYSVQKELKYGVKDNISSIVQIGEKKQYDKKVTLDAIKLPIKKGQTVGKVVITFDNKSSDYDIIALNDVESIFTIENFKKVISSEGSLIYKIAIGSGIVLLISFIIIIISINNRNNRNRRRRRRRYRKM